LNIADEILREVLIEKCFLVFQSIRGMAHGGLGVFNRKGELKAVRKEE
jgi:hypothetical protein